MQTAAGDRKVFAENWSSVLAAAEEALRGGARLLVLPEGTVPAYVLGTEPVDEREVRAAVDALARLAGQFDAVIVCGIAYVEGGATYNGAAVIGGGGLYGVAGKFFLWHFDRKWFARGRALEPIATPLGNLGVLVCADGRIPTIARTLVERGAEVLVMPTAWVTGGRDPLALENVQADLMVNVRARENGVPFVAANKCGVEARSVAYCGKSAIVDARGEFIARAGEREPAILAGTIEAARPSLPPPAALGIPVSAALTHLGGRTRARIAFACEADPHEIEALRPLALQADADLLLSCADAFAGDAAMHDPAALVEARLAGRDLFVWRVGELDEWTMPFARTRAAELRCYVVALHPQRSFAVDPDGAVLAGTFGEYRLAAFGYERARAAATEVAPATDVLDGLRAVRDVRTRSKEATLA